jgi:hypothetical protein
MGFSLKGHFELGHALGQVEQFEPGEILVQDVSRGCDLRIRSAGTQITTERVKGVRRELLQAGQDAF